MNVRCACEGNHPECPRCYGSGEVAYPSCPRCGGTGKEGGRCPNCRGQGYVDLIGIDPAPTEVFIDPA